MALFVPLWLLFIPTRERDLGLAHFPDLPQRDGTCRFRVAPALVAVERADALDQHYDTSRPASQRWAQPKLRPLLHLVGQVDGHRASALCGDIRRGDQPHFGPQPRRPG